ncbi:hypothetical protein FSP39_004562 [Pinctada imbricata]|uniref:Uncharacterized protein n=1 Tax=Pinctada imbricata TaxID=66713 RepID=A0AA89BSF2_PINIB|nr:hypothetical protein FSP39_004562 [Pinctada imbricata]
MFGPPMEGGRFTPLRDGRYTPRDMGRTTPMSRPGTQQLMIRPSSRTNVGTQTDERVTYPDINNRFQTPQPPARPSLQRSNTFSGYHRDDEMDPFTKQYYTRLWRQQVPHSDSNMARMGRAGGRWRHITACTASSGSHMAFVEGTVKQIDNKLVVPLIREPLKNPYATNSNGFRKFSAGKKRNKLNTTYNDHAKNGFKYWYQEQNKPMDPGFIPSLAYTPDIDETMWDSLASPRNITVKY